MTRCLRMAENCRFIALFYQQCSSRHIMKHSAWVTRGEKVGAGDWQYLSHGRAHPPCSSFLPTLSREAPYGFSPTHTSLPFWIPISLSLLLSVNHEVEIMLPLVLSWFLTCLLIASSLRASTCWNVSVPHNTQPVMDTEHVQRHLTLLPAQHLFPMPYSLVFPGNWISTPLRKTTLLQPMSICSREEANCVPWVPGGTWSRMGWSAKPISLEQQLVLGCHMTQAGPMRFSPGTFTSIRRKWTVSFFEAAGLVGPHQPACLC